MKFQRTMSRWLLPAVAAMAVGGWSLTQAQEPAKKKATSYSTVDQAEDFATVMERMKTAKPAVTKKYKELLEARYDLGNHAAKNVTMSRSKPLQEGVRARLPKGMTWDKLTALSPQEIRDKDLFPADYLPLPHPNHPEGGMVFPKFHIDESKSRKAAT